MSATPGTEGTRTASGPAPAPGERSFRQSLLAMLGLSSVVMIVAIDQTVVGTALPSIVADLRRFDLYEWVAMSYLLTFVITVPVFGRLGDWLGRKPLIVIAIVLFTCASALCGVAGTIPELMTCRGVARHRRRHAGRNLLRVDPRSVSRSGCTATLAGTVLQRIRAGGNRPFRAKSGGLI